MGPLPFSKETTGLERDQYRYWPVETGQHHQYGCWPEHYPTDSVKRPQYFGVLTNDIVYKRLAPGVLSELKKVIPKTESGRRKGTLSQGLTRNIGYPKLREHLGATVAFMKISRDYLDFIDKMDTHYPRFGEQYRFAFDYERDQDDGRGL